MSFFPQEKARGCVGGGGKCGESTVQGFTVYSEDLFMKIVLSCLFHQVVRAWTS